ncbi:MAG: hypothetical protein OEO79_19155 [Gemmatimonadota bacterium]|nr:hypothetical protein [Gemmatimonadota bacterium]
MKLSREDVTPLVAILAAGVLGVAITASALDARLDGQVTVLEFEYLSPSAEWQATQGDRVEGIEVRRERQRIIGNPRRELRRGPPDRSGAVIEFRLEREGMAESLEEIERALAGGEPELRALREELRAMERVRRRR